MKIKAVKMITRGCDLTNITVETTTDSHMVPNEISSRSELHDLVFEKKRDEHRRLRLTCISNKLPYLIVVVFGVLLCLIVQADASAKVSTNPPDNMRELLVSSCASFVYTGAAQTW